MDTVLVTSCSLTPAMKPNVFLIFANIDLVAMIAITLVFCKTILKLSEHKSDDY